MVVIVDYGVGNLFSIASSLAALQCEAKVSGNADEILAAERVILPGVGAFGDAMEKLRQNNLHEVVKKVAQKGTPLLGICLGMQLLFEESHEFGLHKGLGLLAGQVVPLQPALDAAGYDYKVPHMGWNPLIFHRANSPLLKDVQVGQSVYYVHSYYATGCEDSLVASSEYGVQVPGVVQRDNVFGTQFHPEKSGAVGLRILKAFTTV